MHRFWTKVAVFPSTFSSSNFLNSFDFVKLKFHQFANSFKLGINSRPLKTSVEKESLPFKYAADV